MDLIERLRAAIKLLYPEEMTPHAERMLTGILDEVEEDLGVEHDL